ncbi:MAG: hypothetical protein WBX25_36985 [Rhodomicrobium sp.]
MTDPEADLSKLAEEMVEAFIVAANENAEGKVFPEFFKHFEDKIRPLIRENDVLPSLDKMRAALLKQLDK